MAGPHRAHRRLEGAGRRAGRCCAGSTSTATARATSPATAASSGPSWSTSSTPTGTGASILGRDDLAPGHFGENFTVDGLPDDEVCVGDRFRIGGALFEVTQPRVTCYRVGLRLGEPRIPALLVAHRRPGFYLRVITEGEVRAGDEIVQVADGPRAASPSPRSTRCSTCPGTTVPPPRGRCGSRRSAPAGRRPCGPCSTSRDEPAGNAGLAAVAPPPAWPGFRPLVVTAVEPETADVVSLRLAAPDGTPLPAPAAGPVPDAAAGAGALVRSYSLSGPPGGPSLPHQRQARTGRRGQRIPPRQRPRRHDPGRRRAPRHLHPRPVGDRPVLLVSAGIGATPLLAMLHDLADRRAGARRLVAARRPRRRRPRVRRGGPAPCSPAGT